MNPATLTALIVGDAYTAELWRPTRRMPPKVERTAVLATARGSLAGAAFSAAGDRVALFDLAGSLQAFDTAAGDPLSRVQVAGDDERIRRISFLPDGRRALVALEGLGTAAARVDTDTGTLLRRFE